MIPGSATPLLLKSAAAGGLQIERSLRFNSSDSGFLSRTPAVAGNRRTWSCSTWLKKCAEDTNAVIMSATGTPSRTVVSLYSGNFYIYSDGGINCSTVGKFRDPSAWYHVLFVLDTTQATAADRTKIYVNGVQQLLTYSQSPGQNTDWGINATGAHRIGGDAVVSEYLNGYLANIHFIDGQALTPSSFTETDATTGQLIPKTYTGSYGTNGFNLLFADNSSNTASTLGKDTSGNSNNWTPNNLSVTAGAGNDSLVDSPTNGSQSDTGVGGEVRGNYATLNPLTFRGSGSTSNGNLELEGNSNSVDGVANVTIGVSSGKWYFEITALNSSGTLSGGQARGAIGIKGVNDDPAGVPGTSANGYGYLTNGQKYNNSSATSYGASFVTNDVLGVALDLDNGTITFYKNNTSQGTAFSSIPSGTYFPSAGGAGGFKVALNAGQRAFAYTAPSGFKALCTQNLPEGTITTSGTYTGNGVADGPFVYLNGVPTAMTVGGNAVTFGTHADKLSNGFKLRTTSTTYNQNALSYSYSITTTGAKFKYARAQPNP